MVSFKKSSSRPQKAASHKSAIKRNSNDSRRRTSSAGTPQTRGRTKSSLRRRPSDNGRIRKRIVIIDACNVGYFHSNHRGFSIVGLQIALNHFLNRNHEAYGMLPKFRLKPGKSNDSSLLNEIYRSGRLITTPCKEFPVRAMCYDDRFMLEIATRYDCAIVSNDQYRDIMYEKPEWEETVRNRRIPFSWNGDNFRVAENHPALNL